jgi:hypothetical protein
MPDEMSELRQSSHNGKNHGACAFVLDAAGGNHGPVNFCNAPSQPGSAYCPAHHASCHLANGSAAERRQLREIEALAEAVGGKRGRVTRHPPARLLRRLDRVARASGPSKDSMNVLLVLEKADGGTADQ